MGMLDVSVVFKSFFGYILLSRYWIFIGRCVCNVDYLLLGWF